MRTQSCHEGCFFLGPVGPPGALGYDVGGALFDPTIDAVEAQILTAGMIKRLFALTMLFCACPALGACSSLSGYVADSWPTWAGGMPKDVPPRPGAPGYNEFIAHQGNEAPAPAAAGPDAAAPAPSPVAATAPVANNPAVQALPSRAPRPEDQSAVQGGLY